MATFNDALTTFLNESPTPFHAVSSMAARLLAAGFVRLDERDAWQVEAGGKYFTTRNDSSIAAWVMPRDMAANEGWRMVGAHTDSPCLKVKPTPEKHVKGYLQLGVETYGGVLKATWLDRDLSLAGRVNYQNTTGALTSALVNFKRPIAIIPSLAIHLAREAANKLEVNAQLHLPPILGQSDEPLVLRDLLKQQLEQDGITDIDKVLDYELSFYDAQPANIVGFGEEFVASARLDNLLSCFIGLNALLHSDPVNGALLVCNDHEEVGSQSACGAQGPMLEQLLMRLYPDTEQRLRVLSQSYMVSADNAHGIHPNYQDKHDASHGPVINDGPVIKLNANQRYATNSETSSVFRALADKVDVPVQAFVMRADMACGSTIGPITASVLGVPTIDVGVPQFAMHSIRETAGTKDAEMLSRILVELYMAESLSES